MGAAQRWAGWRASQDGAVKQLTGAQEAQLRAVTGCVVIGWDRGAPRPTAYRGPAAGTPPRLYNGLGAAEPGQRNCFLCGQAQRGYIRHLRIN